MKLTFFKWTKKSWFDIWFDLNFIWQLFLNFVLQHSFKKIKEKLLAAWLSSLSKSEIWLLNKKVLWHTIRHWVFHNLSLCVCVCVFNDTGWPLSVSLPSHHFLWTRLYSQHKRLLQKLCAQSSWVAEQQRLCLERLFFFSWERPGFTAYGFICTNHSVIKSAVCKIYMKKNPASTLVHYVVTLFKTLAVVTASKSRSRVNNLLYNYS